MAVEWAIDLLHESQKMRMPLLVYVIYMGHKIKDRFIFLYFNVETLFLVQQVLICRRTREWG